MIYFALVLLLITGVLFFARSRVTGESSDAKEARGILKWIGGIVAVVSIVLIFFASLATVGAGHVGLQVLWGKVQIGGTLSPGLHLVNPFVEVVEMSVRTETYTMAAISDEGDKIGDDSIVALSKNGLRMPMDVTIPYRLLPSSAEWVYENVGPDYVNKILRPASRTAVRVAARNFTDQESYASKREELADKMRDELENAINRTLFKDFDNPPETAWVLPTVLLRNVELPERVKNAIEAKLQADQEAQEMEFKIIKERREAERKEIEAGGIKKFQDIVSEGINENLLRWKAIDATLKLSTSKNSKVVIIGSGKDGLPIILGGVGVE